MDGVFRYTYRLTGALSLSLPLDDVDRLLSAADPVAAMLYLHIVREGGLLSLERAGERLRLTRGILFDATRKLGELGLLERIAPREPIPEELGYAPPPIYEEPPDEELEHYDYDEPPLERLYADDDDDEDYDDDDDDDEDYDDGDDSDDDGEEDNDDDIDEDEYFYTLDESTQPQEPADLKDLQSSEDELFEDEEEFPDRTEDEAPPDDKLLMPAVELPEYDSATIVRRSTEDENFRAIVNECQRMFGRMLSGAEMKKLYGFYEYLGLPAEVLVLLINHCSADTALRFGEGRMPTILQIEREAYRWYERELLSLDLAEEYVRLAEQKRGAVGRMKKALKLEGGELNSTEMGFIDRWLGWG